MWKAHEAQLLQAISTSGFLPEVEEYGYQIYRLPLTFKGAYVRRDLLCLSWVRKPKKGVEERKIRPIRVVSERYVLVPHSRLEKELRDAGVKVTVIQTGTRFIARAEKEQAILVVRNSYRVGSFKVDIHLKTESLILPVFTDYFRIPHIATQGKYLTPEAISEAFEFVKVIALQLPKLKNETPSLGLHEFVKNLRVVKREYESGAVVKEEIDEVGKRIYPKVSRQKNLYDFIVTLISEMDKLPDTYLYKRLKERVERYTGAVIREVLKLREALERMRLKKSA